MAIWIQVIGTKNSRSYASYYVMGEFGNNPYNIDMPVGTDGKMDPDAKLNYWGDWRNALLKSRLRQEYTIDFSGKNKKSRLLYISRLPER